jgi:hypothetical protein
MSAEDVHFFMNLRNQIKLYHWQTHVYARHIATDKILAEIDALIDSYVEIYIGKYGRPKLNSTTGTIHLLNMGDAGAVRFIRSAIHYMERNLVKHLNKGSDTDLFNLRDELLANMNQLLYLFTLK